MPFLWGPDGDGHLFWDCPFPPLVAIRESPEFHDVVSLDKSFWPRCLLWHGWLPALSWLSLVIGRTLWLRAGKRSTVCGPPVAILAKGRGAVFRGPARAVHIGPYSCHGFRGFW